VRVYIRAATDRRSKLRELRPLTRGTENSQPSRRDQSSFLVGDFGLPELELAPDVYRNRTRPQRARAHSTEKTRLIFNTYDLRSGPGDG
jgi:hypothetical protein